MPKSPEQFFHQEPEIPERKISKEERMTSEFKELLEKPEKTKDVQGSDLRTNFDNKI